MLKLIDPVRFTAEEQDYIESALKPLGGKGWYDIHKTTVNIKHHISEHTIIAQGARCAYCEEVLSKGSLAIEHIANKGDYPEFSFEPFNLVTSCTSCNSPVNKGQNDTIAKPVDRTDYSNNRFVIVHPYFDNPDEHLKYVDKDKTILDWSNCSLKGKKTIEMFHWNEYWAFLKRLSIAQIRHYPTPVLKIAAEIASYK